MGQYPLSSNEKQKKPLPWQLPAYIFRRTQISCLTAIVLFWLSFDSHGIPRRIISQRWEFIWNDRKLNSSICADKKPAQWKSSVTDLTRHTPTNSWKINPQSLIWLIFILALSLFFPLYVQLLSPFTVTTLLPKAENHGNYTVSVVYLNYPPTNKEV